LENVARGFTAPGFEQVADAFEQNFSKRGEMGAGVAVYHRGQLVVDLVGGIADKATGDPFTHQTLVNVYSVGKAIIGLLALQLVDQGNIDLDSPIAEVWPEYAAHGKQATTLRMALCHRAGVPAIGPIMTNEDLYDFDVMAQALAATAPWHEPGTGHAYHTNTYGHLIGEVVRRVSGRRPGELLADVMSNIGAEVYLGLDQSLMSRCATIDFETTLQSTSIDLDALEGDQAMVLRSYFNPPGYSSFDVVNTKQWRQAIVPSTNMHATANGVATFYNALLTPGRLVGEELLVQAASVQSAGPCPILGEFATFGLGFTPTTERRPLGPNPFSFGHFGTGGSLGFADPTAEVAFGYVMNHVIPRWQSTRNAALREAVYASIQ